jgi:hypothetical protein
MYVWMLTDRTVYAYMHACVYEHTRNAYIAGMYTHEYPPPFLFRHKSAAKENRDVRYILTMGKGHGHCAREMASDILTIFVDIVHVT